MDDRRFDDLARLLATHRSRRSFFGAAAGAAAAGLLAHLPAARPAAALRCQSAAECSAPTDPCRRAVCTRNRCSTAPAPDGTACNDGNLCTTGDTCRGGACTGGTAKVCAASDQCHLAGTCNPATGLCSNPQKANGSACNDGNACTTNDVCTGGVCAGTPKVCTAFDQCHNAGNCDPATGLCSNPNKADGTPCDDGNRCTTGETCRAGVCRSGSPVACPAPGPCQQSVSCNPQSGACEPVNKPDGTPCGADSACTLDVCQGGQCVHDVAKPAGTACNDANSCTQSDACDGRGTCVGGAPVVCAAPDACHTQGTCDPATGTCDHPQLPGTCFVGGTCYRTGEADPSNPCRVCAPGQTQTAFSARANGTACNDGNACTQTDTCQNGVCVGGNPVVCTASDQCHVAGTCDPATGQCTNPDKTDGAICDDHNACTQNDTCQGGVCTPGTAVVCGRGDECHEPGACNPANGQCSNPPKPDGTECHAGNLCNGTGTCQNGACGGLTAVVCTPPDQCHVAACDPATGTCVISPAEDGRPCGTAGQICQRGECVTTTSVCGDGVCDGGETCSNCPADCGPCCTEDADCVGATCCYPSSCVPLAQAPRGCGQCNADCPPYTLTCGRGYCACQSGSCVAVWVCPEDPDCA